MVDSRRCLLLVAFSTLSIVLAAGADAAPQTYLTEQVQASYSWNGSLSAPVSRIGYVEVSAGSVQDVLQYVRLTLTSTSGTNLVSDTAFRSVAASPNYPDDRTRIFVNTTNSTEDLSYQITNAGLAPLIGMRLDYRNQIGGREIIPGRNTLSFSLMLTASQALSGATLVVQARRNTFGLNDSLSFTSVSASSGFGQALDSDFDGFNDRITWSGDLPAGGLMINFTADVTPGVNFNEGMMSVSLDEGQTSCAYSGPQTFTGATFSGRFSRGPVREGIEIIQVNTWITRGFIKNIAADTTYMLNGWELYEIGNPVPVLNSTAHSTINPGDTKSTDWYDSGLVDKPAYFSSSFNWEVAWAGSNYRGISASSMSMPALYEMDSWPDATTVLQSDTAAGRSVRINMTDRHLGHSSISVNRAFINSTLPRLSAEGLAATWTPSLIRVYYTNGTGTFDVTSSAVTQTQNSGSGDGFVYAEIADISSALGHYMQQNDYLTLSYVASSPASSSNENYTFAANMTLVTLSGTPVTKAIRPYITIPGVIITQPPGGGGGGGGGGPPAAAFADIVKESADAYFVTAGTVKVAVVAGVIDSGDKGIKDVRVLAYVPKDSTLDPESAVLRIYHKSSGTWDELKLGKDFSVTDMGLTTVGKEEYREYLIKRATPAGSLFEQTIDMRNGDRIEVDYKTDIPFGTSYLLTRIFGYNYYIDGLVFEDAYTPVRRELSQLEKFQVDEGEWVQGEAMVGKPVKWTKIFTIYNPNNVSVEETMTTNVFQDSLGVELAESGVTERTKLQLKGGSEITVNWFARLGAGERKTYMIEASTPPVLETRREITVLQSNKTSIRLIANITMENFARERYLNVTLDFPVHREKIIMISDPSVTLEDSEDGVRIISPGFEGLEVRNLSLMYMETPPMLAATLNAIKFGCSDYAKVTVIVVPSEEEAGTYLETEVVGPEPNLITSHAEITDLQGAKPYQEITTPIMISLASYPSGNYFVYTRYNRDFTTILSDQKEFSITCPGRDFQSISWIFVLLASLIVTGFLGIRVYRRKSYEKEMSELKKKVKGI